MKIKFHQLNNAALLYIHSVRKNNLKKEKEFEKQPSSRVWQLFR